jgi:hypothetical protein
MAVSVPGAVNSALPAEPVVGKAGILPVFLKPVYVKAE